MNRPAEPRDTRECIDATVEALDRMADGTDAQTEQALGAARRKALDAAQARRLSSWHWAAATAAVLALAIVLAFVYRNGNDLPPLNEQLVADAELYQEMEFYLWLSEELESEQ